LLRQYKIDPFHIGEYAYLILSNQADTAEENAAMLMTSNETESGSGSKIRMDNPLLRQRRFSDC
jgi:hypothetical protein